MDTMTSEEYSFYLAYGVTDDQQLADLEFIDNVMEFLFVISP